MKFEPQFFAGNRQRLLKAVQADIILVSAHGLLQKSNDEPYFFQQDSNFWYLTGVEEPDFVLAMSAKETFLIAPERASHRDFWDGALDFTAMCKASDIGEVLSNGHGWQRVREQLGKGAKVGLSLPPPTYIKPYGFYTNPARRVLQQRVKRLAPQAEVVDIRMDLARLRQIKQSPELEILKKTITITKAATNKLQKTLADFNFEYEVEAFLDFEYKRQGARHGFDPIVASGRNAATIHYRGNRNKIDKKQLLLLDTGAMLGHYSADISRTLLPVGGATARQLQVVEAVKLLQKHGMTLIKPGVDLKSYEKQMREAMSETLVTLGVLKKVPKELPREVYPHATSHHLGLDLHDVWNYDDPFAPGMVLTIEPGIYLPKENIGVRIEDDFLITKTGVEVL